MAPMATGAELVKSQQERFQYDYDSLRLGGLVVAAIFFVLGILLILSRHCRCKFDQQPKTGEPDEDLGPLRQSMRRLSTRMR